MKAFTLRIASRGSLLVGGGDIPDGFHGAHVKDGEGHPVVPATAIRGALRETLEALLRGAGRPACDGGLGHDLNTETEATGPCSLDGGRPCLPCRLFGGARDQLAPGAVHFSSLMLGDAALDSDSGTEWMTRPGVGIGRRQRSAAENRLFLRRTTATGALFSAKGWLRGDEFSKELEAAVRATTHIGAGRSRGSARVDLSLDWSAPEAAPPPLLPEGDIRIRLTLRSPAILGIPLAQLNFRDTRREIPGSALRGAIGFALAASLNEPDNDAVFKALVNEESGAQFGFLYPVDWASVDDAASPAVLPLTSAFCKTAGREHGLHDDLLDRIATEHITHASQVPAVQEGSESARCARCGAPLRSAKGYRRLNGEVAIRMTTRAALDRRAASARDQALFTESYLDAGNVFEGSIRCVPNVARDMLASSLALPLSIGRAQGSGRGQVSVEVLGKVERGSLLDRGCRFDEALTKHLQRCGLPLERVGSLLTLTFLSPGVFEQSGSDEWKSIIPSLPEGLRGLRPFIRVRRFVREGTWDQRTGSMHAWQAIAAGAVYVLELPDGRKWKTIIKDLELMESSGVGTRRHQGYGRVQLFDSIHIRTPKGTSNAG